MLSFLTAQWGFLKPIICFEPHISSYNKNHNFKPVLENLFKLGYSTKYLSSNSIDGTNRIMSLNENYKSKTKVKSDGEIRSIFENINNQDTIKILTSIGGARTVLLKPNWKIKFVNLEQTPSNYLL